jgi:hypothetical protein
VSATQAKRNGSSRSIGLPRNKTGANQARTGQTGKHLPAKKLESIVPKVARSLRLPPLAGLTSLRTSLVSGAALIVLASATSPADARMRRLTYSYYGGYQMYGGWQVSQPDFSFRRARIASSVRRERTEPKRDPGFGELAKGPLQIVVGINSQKVTLYSGGVRVAQGGVSTGMPGHPTPMGVFSVIEKDRYHHSNIYSGAPMPYMQRITWSGVALHEGVLPGHPASHGCIRMSHDFASKLWPITQLGVRVIVARTDVAPADFEHPKLFVPKQKPAASPVAQIEPTDGRGEHPIVLAQIESQPTASRPAAEAAPESANEAVRASEGPDPGEPASLGKIEETVTETGTVQAIPAGENPDTVAPVELRRAAEAPPAAQPASQPESAPPAASPAATEAKPENEIGKPMPSADPAKPIAPRGRTADQPVKRSGHVAVFVSRKEKKIFVRQGFTPIFEMPVVIDEPDRPLGTHVFTAVALTDDGAAMRWNVMTVPNDLTAQVEYGRRRSSREPAPKPVQLKPASDATEALNRIEIPQEAADRIGELLSPGSSLVLSDDGLGRETGRGTDFVVLTR